MVDAMLCRCATHLPVRNIAQAAIIVRMMMIIVLTPINTNSDNHASNTNNDNINVDTSTDIANRKYIGNAPP